MQKNTTKKIFLAFFIGVFLIIQVMGSFLYAQRSYAITGAPDVVAYMTQKDVKASFWDALYSSALQVLVNAASRYARDLAYNSAVYISSGGKGKNPLVHQDSFGDYLGQAAGDAVAETVEAIGKKAGLNLCEIPDANLLINLRIGLRNAYADAKAGQNGSACNWQKLKDGWSQETFERKYGPGGSRFMDEVFATSFQVSDSDFGIALDGIAQIDESRASRSESAKLDRQEGDGFKSLTSLISGKILSPAQTIKEESKVNTSKHEGEVTTSQITGLYAAEAWQIFPMAASVFLNTLANQMLDKIFNKGLYPDPGRGAQGLSFENDTSAIDPRERAKKEFSFLKVVNPLPVGSQDILQDMRTCPDNPGLNNCVIDDDFAQALDIANNSEPMTIAQAMNLNGSGDGTEYLHGSWKLISPVNEAEHNDKDCYNGAYCYSNLQKLRRQRILPLGFEIAALRSDPDQPPTLKEVIEGFDDCPYVDDNGDGIDDIDGDTGEKLLDTSRLGDPEFRWCRILNPNWVLRAPLHKCEMGVYGPELLAPDLALRKPECADISTCIYENESGKCVTPQAYGYCLKEENIWRTGADSCEWQNATCKAYTNQVTGQITPYLARTVDYAQCDANSSGCLAYALEQDENGQWIDSYQTASNVDLKLLGRNGSLYLNSEVSSNYCANQEAEGCSAFYTNPDASNQTRLFLKKAPDYLGCYDIDRSTPEIDWPTTLAQVINDLPNNPACGEFSQVCVEQEVGCQAFTPLTVDGDVAANPLVPGIVGGSSCNQECLGYSAYRQVGVQFESEKFPMYINPYSQNAGECRAQDVGCEEFTDLSAGAGEREAYFKKIRFCEQPDANRENEKTFYTWEASVDDGQRLRTHRLLQIDDQVHDYLARMAQRGAIDGLVQAQLDEVFPVGSPAYDSFDPAVIAGYLELCNEETYNNRINNINPDNQGSTQCLRFFDDDNQEYYRLVTKTVEISAQCNPFRKTNAELYIDVNVSGAGDQDVCQQWGGLWEAPSQIQLENQNLDLPIDEPVCQRCQGGGKYENGVCIYEAIEGGQGTESCNPDAAMCREYVGNGGNNVAAPIFSHDFEADDFGNEESLQEAMGGFAAQNDNDLQIAAEGLSPNEHSLQISAVRAQYHIDGGMLKSDNTTGYELRFWTRGVAQAVDIYFEQGGQEMGRFTYNIAEQEVEEVSVGDNWREVVLGPVLFGGDASQELNLVFVSNDDQNQPYFIDKLSLSPSTQKVYRIKGSWETIVEYQGQNVRASVPLSCDANPTDGLPGEGLGCSQYQFTNVEGDTGIVFTSGFDKLCRENAVGCIPMYDTYNSYSQEANDFETGDDLAHVYNTLCEMSSRERELSNKCKVLYDGQSFECEVAPDQTTCHIPNNVIIDQTLEIVEINGEQVVVPDGADADDLRRIGDGLPAENRLILDVASIYVPADTPADSPLYMTARQDFACQSNEVGCLKVGQQAQVLPRDDQASAYQFEDVYVMNRPENYSQMLCRADQLGCSTFSLDADIYFKDPAVIGNKICEYKQPEGGTPGWYIQGVGTCSHDSDVLCKADADCGQAPDGERARTCNTADPVACYRDPLFVRRDTPVGEALGIFSNESPRYDGFVGSCPLEQHMCGEFIDPQDTSAEHPNGEPYYFIYNDKVIDKEGQCDGQVSQTEGCVLFNYTEDPNRVYNSAASYQKSFQEGNYGLVDVVTEPSNDDLRTLDANRIIKVNRDRQCSEWLECRSKIKISGRDEPLCYEYGVCNARNEDGTECVSWVTPQSIDDGLEPLNYDSYVTRNVSWSGFEYTGYSLYNRRQIPNLEYFITVEGYDTTYIGHKVDDRFFAGDPDDQGNEGFSDRACKQGNESELNWTACGPDNGGRCYKGSCLYPVAGQFPASIRIDEEDFVDLNANQQVERMKEIESNLLPYLEGGSCKSFPEQDSPFPNYVAEQFSGSIAENQGNLAFRRDHIQNVQGFEKVNVCQFGDCSCGYTKVNYGEDITSDYWPLTKNFPAGKCTGNGLAGQACNVDADCTYVYTESARPGEAAETTAIPGICNKLSKKEVRIGVEGYCLERDFSRPIQLETRKEYPCLTWMPLQISAALNDTFNSNVEAGYNPSIDAIDATGAATGGEVYCIDSTSMESGAYDASNMYTRYSSGGSMYEGGNNGDIVIPDADNTDIAEISELTFSNYPLRFDGARDREKPFLKYFLDNYFDENTGRPLSGDDDCSEDEDADYGSGDIRAVVCRPGTKGTTSLLQIWSWYNISKDAVVLRNDRGGAAHHDVMGEGVAGGNGGNVDGAAAGGYEINNGSIEINVDTWAPYTLAANTWAYSNQDGRDNGGDYEGFEIGTVMHPPRLWKEDGSFISDYTVDFAKVANQSFVNSEIFSHFENQKINTKYYSPEKNSNEYVYVSDIEASLNEKQIRKVYFLVTSYHGNVSHQSIPAMYDKQLYIDFEQLQSIKSHANLELVSGPGRYGDKHRQVNPTIDGGEEARNKWWTYMLDASDVDGLLSFDNYLAHGGYSTNYRVGISDQVSPFSDERNKIHRRYVAVLADNGSIGEFGRDFEPEFMKTATTGRVGRPIQGSDPFSEICENKGSNGGRFWAIGMDFNKQGEFLGYITRFCNPEKDDDDYAYGGFSVGVVAELNDICVDYGGVHNSDINPISGDANKAWTNITWNESQKDTATGWHSSFIGHAFPNPPYGSLPMSYRDLESSDRSLLLSRASFAYPDYNGIPYKCDSKLLSYDYLADINGQVPVNAAGGNGSRGCAGLYRRDAMYVYPASPFEFIERNDVATSGGIDLSQNVETARAAGILKGLFSKISKRVGFGENNNVVDKSITNLDVSGLDANGRLLLRQTLNLNGGRVGNQGNEVIRKVIPPQIYSLNPVTCSPLNDSAKCTPGTKDNVSVNGRTYLTTDYNADGVYPEDKEDEDADFFVDAMIYRGRAPAKLQFFAFADHDAMPIRQVRVDWQDGSSIVNKNKVGLYKNQKPFCQSSSFSGSQIGVCRGLSENDEDGVLQLLCSQNSDCPIEYWRDAAGETHAVQECVLPAEGESFPAYFGDSQRACNEGYFEFIHTYTCTQDDINSGGVDWVKTVNDNTFSEAEIRELREYDVGVGDKVCVFKPRVQVKDNWGWCNGMCSADYRSNYNRSGVAFDKPYRLGANVLYVEDSPYHQPLFLGPEENGSRFFVTPYLPGSASLEGEGRKQMFAPQYSQTMVGYEGCWDDFSIRGSELPMCEKNFSDVITDPNDPNFNNRPYVEFAGKIIVVPTR
ncbi:hypothetical protein H6758_03880 [Candidatus Nomurabacteria bacterium]|nr:hypothetical protein [Candidatus Nomurabacteria bacterium]